jgi:cell fate regulator YaaT (PSP1 superfamily)
MKNLAVVVFGEVGRPVECDAGELTLRHGDLVIVDDRRGGAMARVTVPSHHRSTRAPLARVLRIADAGDLEAKRRLDARTAEAHATTRAAVRQRELPMKVFRVELGPRGEKATIFFAAEERVDFRDLLRDLVTLLGARVELRQVGVRDEAKMVGGIGSCGRELCCSTFLPRFAPVSIKMAKHQNLALTPSKISGQCGRLKCCLIYEDEVYVEAAKLLPRLGKTVETPDGPGRVSDLDVLRGRVRVSFADKPAAVFTSEQVRPASAGAPVAEDPRPGPGARPGPGEGQHEKS